MPERSAEHEGTIGAEQAADRAVQIHCLGLERRALRLYHAAARKARKITETLESLVELLLGVWRRGSGHRTRRIRRLQTLKTETKRHCSKRHKNVADIHSGVL